jgi:predicted O-linked N-acetylglucosamine transferase (SPINDLY family)
LHQNGHFDAAERLYRRVLAADPRNVDALHLLGVLHAQRSQYFEAAELIGRAIALHPYNPAAFYNHANVLQKLKRRDEALLNYDKALALKATDAETWCNRGAVLQELGRATEAIASFDRALALKPSHVTALFNRANALRSLRRPEDALLGYDLALRLRPDFAEAFNGRASVLQDLHRYDEAFAAYDRAFSLDPRIPYVEGWRLHCKMHICDWSNLEHELDRLSRNVDKGEPAAAPYVLLGMDASARRQLMSAKIYAEDLYPAVPSPLWRGETYSHRAIRIGYVSGEFHDQATAHLTAEMYECHDRQAFEIHAYATGLNDRSAMRARLEKAFDRFVDASMLTDQELARAIRRAEIDILVNLNGYFGAERSGAFAMRPAPVQVNYLGYPGTMGVPYMDYIVADKHIVPEDQKDCYSEKLVYLPHTYQPNDRKREIAARALTRSDCDLPQDGFVFCCFNNNFKITPQLFDIWMRLLGRNEGSVLWLFEGNASVKRNLAREAERRGIAADRIIFARYMKRDEHLARTCLADLFLDTLPHNAHTTASDALWCGVPVLTCVGTSFAGRVAASLLRAVGLDELVTHSLEDYEALALNLARHPGQLHALKERLARNRDKAALFDTPGYTRSLEAAYRIMWKHQQSGQLPESLAVEN